MNEQEEKKYTLKELKEKLTEKERLFCHQYIINWNGARSAREAGYSEDSAKEIAHATLTKVHIQQYIDFIKNDFEKEAGITKLSQLNELKKIAYSSIAHIHNTWIELNEFEALTDEQKECIESIDTKIEIIHKYDQDSDSKKPVEIKYIKIKLYSKIQAIDQINKMLGYNAPDKLEHSGEVKTNAQPDLSKLSEKTLKQVEKELGKNGNS